MHQARARGAGRAGDVVRPFDDDGAGRLRLALARVELRESRAVDHEVRRQAPEAPVDLVGPRDVELERFASFERRTMRAVTGDQVMVGRQLTRQRGSQKPARAGDKDADHR